MPPTQIGWVTQVNSDDGAGHSTVGIADPDVGTPLVGECGSGLGEDQAVGKQKRDREHQRPCECLATVVGYLPERFETDHRSDQQENDVEPAQRLVQLGGLLFGKNRWGDGHGTSGARARPAAVLEIDHTNVRPPAGRALEG